MNDSLAFIFLAKQLVKVGIESNPIKTETETWLKRGSSMC